MLTRALCTPVYVCICVHTPTSCEPCQRWCRPGKHEGNKMNNNKTSDNHIVDVIFTTIAINAIYLFLLPPPIWRRTINTGPPTPCRAHICVCLYVTAHFHYFSAVIWFQPTPPPRHEVSNVADAQSIQLTTLASTLTNAHKYRKSFGFVRCQLVWRVLPLHTHTHRYTYTHTYVRPRFVWRVL